MNANEYQHLSTRTICDQDKARTRISGCAAPDGDWLHSPSVRPDAKFNNLTPVQLLHAVGGALTELGELFTLLQKWLWYGKKMTEEEVRLKLKDEFGDALWYIAEGLSAAGLLMGDVMEGNINKLSVRYPEKYTDYHADETHRDRAAEARAVQAQVCKHDISSMAAQEAAEHKAKAPFGRDYLGDPRKVPHPNDKTPRCTLSPEGWFCTRELGHPGPCASHPVKEGCEPVVTLPPASTCHYCNNKARYGLTWFHGPPGKPGPVTVPYCGKCSLKDALAKRGMTAPVKEGEDYSLTLLVKETVEPVIEQDVHGFGHEVRAVGGDPRCPHNWTPIQTPAGDGRKCLKCGAVDPD